MTDIDFRYEKVFPWALRPTICGKVIRPESLKEIHEILESTDQKVVVRAKGTAYGDSSVNLNGYHISTAHLNKFVEFDWKSGVLTCQSGVTLAEITNLILPKGWVLPVVPGTLQSTLGGCIACDVHGKNHHVEGSFISSVQEFKIITADGDICVCSKDANTELFWATAGGLGQTGVILEATLRLKHIETGYIKATYYYSNNIDETFSLIEGHPEATYSVCWIDSLAHGESLGKGILMLGEHALCQDLIEFGKNNPLGIKQGYRLALPFYPPSFIFGNWAWKTFNNAYFIFNKIFHQNAQPHLMDYYKFFCPLDRVSHWNRVYGRNGFIEYQIAVPIDGGKNICKQVLEKLSNTGNGSFLAVIKKFGPGVGDKPSLSFPIEGYTLAIDMKAGNKEQFALLASLDKEIASAGGRIYLVKDSRMTPQLAGIMYPKLNEWRSVVDKYDSRGILSSSLMQRLGFD